MHEMSSFSTELIICNTKLCYSWFSRVLFQLLDQMSRVAALLDGNGDDVQEATCNAISCSNVMYVSHSTVHVLKIACVPTSILFWPDQTDWQNRESKLLTPSKMSYLSKIEVWYRHIFSKQSTKFHFVLLFCSQLVGISTFVYNMQTNSCSRLFLTIWNL
jgi:hypothetical protein